MRFLQRTSQQMRQPDGDPDAMGTLDQIRAQADQMLAAGDEAIRRALARGDSESFLRASRQQGGQ